MKSTKTHLKSLEGKGLITIILVIILALLIIYGDYLYWSGPKILGVIIRINQPYNKIGQEVEIKAMLPESFLLSVPFVCQAPFANWNIHEESCEEIAILMNHCFIEGKSLTPDYADKELLVMRQWQKDHYGQEKDMTCQEAVQFIKDYYNYTGSRVFTDIKALDIKKQIAQGNLVIVPVMTHSLLNPHYGPKSVYHFVLIKGYNPQGVITNDAGVKEGENYFYPWDVLFSAIDAQAELGHNPAQQDAQTSKMGQGRTMFIMKK
jgi:hypothetical protein